MSAGEFNYPTRLAIRERDDYRCARCGGIGDWRGMQVHHRRPRGAGGTRRKSTSSPANGLHLCADCHDWIESHRAVSVTQGWLVPQHREPVDVPVKHHLYGWVTLTDQGTVLVHERAFTEEYTPITWIPDMRHIARQSLVIDPSDLSEALTERCRVHRSEVTGHYGDS